MTATRTITEAGAAVVAVPVETSMLTILFDERCAFCVRCRDWLATQPCLVDVELLPAGSKAARERYGDVPWLGEELVAVDEHGKVWAGPSAFLVALWATARYRSLSYLLARRGMFRFAERFFIHVSKRRSRWSAWLGGPDADCSYCDDVKFRLDPDP
jgi:predicted DCC family thiol-disulfide oxidoreductase YuxK